MSLNRRRSTLLALGAATAILVAACGGSATPSPSTAPSEAPPSEAPSEAPYEAMAYPTSGEVDCDAKSYNDKDYTGQFKKIYATDARTVVFELCTPDVAFLSKIAFTSFAINDTEWLKTNIDPNIDQNQAIVDNLNGTGPYKLKEWKRGQEVVMEANPDYWGEAPKTQTLVIKWGTEATQRLTELQAGTVDGIDNVGPTDFAAVEGDPNLQLKPRPGLNVFYVGFNNNPKNEGFDNSTNPLADEAVRQAIAMGIDRQRIVDNFYPPGSEVASHFTPCDIPNGCAGEEWYEFDAAKAKQMLADAGYPNGFSTKIHYRDVVRGYLPDPNVVATDLQAQLKNNLGIDATIDVQESGTFLDNSDAGLLEGIHLLGWGADYPDVTNFLDYHFGAGSSNQFGDKWDDITSALSEGAGGASDDERAPAYEEANNAIKQHVPMIPIAHGGSGVAYRADVVDGHASPLGNEYFAVMTPGDRDQFVFMQNAEPPGLYCADESDGEALRVCEQMMESLYSYEVAGTAAQPALAEVCEPNESLTVWTCTLREGVTFHDGATLDANDVVMSYGIQWDAEDPLHKGRDGSLTYFSSLFGGFLNPPPAE
ncbi:MAG TPA: ABC transporter substrate-binding protein [Candidatus Limnocylindrales bacterium]|nr:ABC transporter substrate-binding protein [Candidatus Limnocylindrales bacterium]